MTSYELHKSLSWMPVCIVLLSACSEDSGEVITHRIIEPHLVESDTYPDALNEILTKGYKWEDHELPDGRKVKLFAAPGFPADSAHHYSIKENGRPYFIRVSQYGKSWIGNVLDNTEGEEKAFESITAPSLDDCLELIRNQHGFTGEIKKLLMD